MELVFLPQSRLGPIDQNVIRSKIFHQKFVIVILVHNDNGGHTGNGRVIGAMNIGDICLSRLHFQVEFCTDHNRSHC